MPTVLNTIGDHILKRRMELGILQSQLAERFGVEVDTIRNWERNRSRPTLRYRPAILEFLGYDPVPKEPETLGEKLLKYRRDRGMTQKELARRIGIDPGTISRLERGMKNRSFASVIHKAERFLCEDY